MAAPLPLRRLTKRSIRVGRLLCACAVVSSGASWSQDAVMPPPTRDIFKAPQDATEPGEFLVPPGVERGEVQRQLEQMRVPHTTVPNALLPAPEQPVPADAEQLRFTLKGIEIEGGTVYRRREDRKS